MKTFHWLLLLIVGLAIGIAGGYSAGVNTDAALDSIEQARYQHIQDSLRNRADILRFEADQYREIAEGHKRRADSLSRISRTSIIDHALRTYRDASLDSVWAVLMSEPK